MTTIDNDGDESAAAPSTANNVATEIPSRLRRCILPAAGLYEWKTVNKKKLPVHFRPKTGEPFGFAGVWDVWNAPTGEVFSCTIITTTPNELTGTVHNRTPGILGRGDAASWVGQSASSCRITLTRGSQLR